MAVQLVVLTSGEKLIGHYELVEDSGRSIVKLTKPLAVKEMVTAQGISYLLLPFLPMKGDFILVRPNSGSRLVIHGREFRMINDDTVEGTVLDPRGIKRK